MATPTKDSAFNEFDGEEDSSLRMTDLRSFQLELVNRIRKDAEQSCIRPVGTS